MSRGNGMNNSDQISLEYLTERLLTEGSNVERWVKVTYDNNGNDIKDLSWVEMSFDDLIHNTNVGSLDNPNAPYDSHTGGRQQNTKSTGRQATQLYAERGKGVEINFDRAEGDASQGGDTQVPSSYSLAFYNPQYVSIYPNADFADPKQRSDAENKIWYQTGDLRPFNIQ